MNFAIHHSLFYRVCKARSEEKLSKKIGLTVNIESGGWTQPAVGYIFGYTCVIGSVFFSGLNYDQVTICCLNVIGISFGLDFYSIF